ncbi:D-alanyl-D-alanine carboxypeptidase [SAR116 cluster alpha proteobacterium HIMB100]|nr:D-alanyl-D-alanine carboxypeptidase [SAR116 cluster alpha proteobacterium HIMB100]
MFRWSIRQILVVQQAVTRTLPLAICILIIAVMAPPTKASSDVPTVAEYVFVTDFNSGRVLMAKQQDLPMKPASMAKIMTTYVVFDRIAEGSLALSDQFVVSEKAWKMGGSRSFLQAGRSYSLDELLHGIIVQSGNDAAVVIAEGISGSEENFVAEMNMTATKLGMKNTRFTNATGWPHPDLTTTAEDLGILATALIRDFPVETYPDLYPVFGKKTYTLNKIKQGNRNPLLYGKSAANSGVDGLKTGYTSESGYGLVASAERDGQRVIMVLNGMASKKERSSESRRLMDFIFREYRNYNFFASGEVIDQAEVWLGEARHVSLVLEEGVSKVLSRSERAKTELSVSWSGPVPAPISKGQKIGELILKTDGQITDRLPLLAAEDVRQLGMLDRIGEALKYLIFGAPVQPAPAT